MNTAHWYFPSIIPNPSKIHIIRNNDPARQRPTAKHRIQTRSTPSPFQPRSLVTFASAFFIRSAVLRTYIFCDQGEGWKFNGAFNGYSVGAWLWQPRYKQGGQTFREFGWLRLCCMLYVDDCCKSRGFACAYPFVQQRPVFGSQRILSIWI